MALIGKKFDKQLHDRFDAPSRSVTKAFFAEVKGIQFEDGSTKFQVDGVSKDGRIFDVECRTCWTQQDFPFSTIHIIGRRFKYFLDHKGFYVIMSPDFKRLAFCPLEKIDAGFKSGELVAKPFRNKYCSDEVKLDIPIEWFEFHDVSKFSTKSS